MKASKLTTKIKIVGLLLVITMLISIATTIYINKKYENAAKVINTAGKQRMYTQKISKNIYYAFKLKNLNFKPLNEDVIYFEEALELLNKKDPFNSILINQQLKKVNSIWDDFKYNIDEFKDNIRLHGRYYSLDNIKANNIKLLNHIDILVDMYLEANEKKTYYLHIFQMSSFLILLLLVIYSISILKKTEEYVHKFLEYGQSIVSGDAQDLSSLNIDGDKIEEDVAHASSVLNNFMEKVNCAVVESNNALEHSQKASQRLEEISEEFGDILNEFEYSDTTEDVLDKSEDIIIESNEDLLKSTKKLQKLKDELDKLLLSCK